MKHPFKATAVLSCLHDVKAVRYMLNADCAACVNKQHCVANEKQKFAPVLLMCQYF